MAIKEKATGEKYKSKAAMLRHEKKEGPKERKKEYGSAKAGECPKCGKVMKMAKGGVVKKPSCMACGGMVKKGK